jgi:hypothetical protein
VFVTLDAVRRKSTHSMHGTFGYAWKAGAPQPVGLDAFLYKFGRLQSSGNLFTGKNN